MSANFRNTTFETTDIEKTQFSTDIGNDYIKTKIKSYSDTIQPSKPMLVVDDRVTKIFPTHIMNDNKQPESMPLFTKKEITLVSQNLGTNCNTSLKRKKSLPSHFSDYIGFKRGNSEINYDNKIKIKNNPKRDEVFFASKKYNTKNRKYRRKNSQIMDKIKGFDMSQYKYGLPKSFENYECMRSMGKDNKLIQNNRKVDELHSVPEDERKISDQDHIVLNGSKCCVCLSSIEGSKVTGPPLSNLLQCTQLTGHQFMLLLGMNLTSNMENSEENGIAAGESNKPKYRNIYYISQKYEEIENFTLSVASDCNQICKRCYSFIKKGDQAYRQLYDIYKELEKICLHGQNENLSGESSLSGKVEEKDGQIVKHEKINFSPDVDLVDNENIDKPLFRLYNIITGKYQENKEKKKDDSIASNINNISLSDSLEEIRETTQLHCIFCKETYTDDSEWINHLKTYHNVDSKWCSVPKFSDFNKLLFSELNLNLQKYMCIACKRYDFVSKDIFIYHLLNDHRINVNDVMNYNKSFDILCQEPSVNLVRGFTENSNSKEPEQVMITIKSEPNIDSPKIKSITKTPKVLTGKKLDVTKFWNCNVCSNKFISEDALNNHIEIVGHHSLNHIEKKDMQPVNSIAENQVLQVVENIKTYKESKTKAKRNRSTREYQYKKKIKGKSICLKLDKTNIDESIDSVEKKIILLENNMFDNIEDNITSVDVNRSIDNEIKDITSVKAENTSIQKPHVEMYQNNDIITHELIVLECEECGSRFLNHTALGLHMTRIHGRPRKLDKVFSCHKCDYKAPTNGKLKTHMKTLHGIDNSDKAQCHECGGFYTPNFIKKHIENMHSNKCEHVCRFCNMKFRAVYLMKAHIASEHLNNRWRCDICDQEFDKYHRMRMHKIHQHQTSSFLCMKCDKTFKRKGDLTAHMKRAHMKKEEFKCMYCPRSYLDKGKYRNHLINKHNIPWHKTISKNYCKILRENNMLKVPPMRKKTTQSRDFKDDHERATVAEAVGYLQAIDKVKLDGEELHNEEHYDIIEVILENP